MFRQILICKKISIPISRMLINITISIWMFNIKSDGSYAKWRIRSPKLKYNCKRNAQTSKETLKVWNYSRVYYYSRPRLCNFRWIAIQELWIREFTLNLNFNELKYWLIQIFNYMDKTELITLWIAVLCQTTLNCHLVVTNCN